MSEIMWFVIGAVAGIAADRMGAWDWIKEVSVAAYNKLTGNIR